MILELIALGSLTANRTLFEENRIKFHKHWNPADILRDIEKINPGFYPEPIKDVPSSAGGKAHLVTIKDGFLTKDELVNIHGRTRNILHAQNPFKKECDYSEYEKAIPGIIEKIRLLLNSHKIQLLGHQNYFYLIHMKEARDEHVHYYKFERIDAPE